MSERAGSAAPPWAILIWCDLTRIFIQLPSTHGPCVLDYPRDSHGISDVLNLMKSRHFTEGMGEIYHTPLNPLRKQAVPLSPNSQDKLRDFLRRKGIGK
jgi:hypothetical protein